ncbi:MAG: SocA family protein, partial [Bacteroidales bacterium]|nr:SocA family protein [Bacteroidales bacterium]
TGSRYSKLPFGPVPQELDQVFNLMIKDGQLQRIKTEYHGYPQTRYLPLKRADLSKMSAAEKEVIDQVIDRFSDWSASMISNYSHNDKPWRATEENELIDYELVFYRRPPYSVRVYEENE